MRLPHSWWRDHRYYLKCINYLINIGLNVVKSIYKQYPKAIVCLLEKEKDPGLHTSGRNSGVIHAGIYYSTNTFKAKFCKEGNKRLTKYCINNGLDINQCGKFIVASNPKEYGELYNIYKQGIRNGIEIKLMTKAQALK